METTALRTFCEASNFKLSLRNCGLSPEVQECANIIDSERGQLEETFLLGAEDFLNPGPPIKLPKRALAVKNPTVLSKQTLSALRAIEPEMKKDLQCASWRTPTSAFLHSYLTVDGFTYSTRDGLKSSCPIFWIDGDVTHAGMLTEIISAPYQRDGGISADETNMAYFFLLKLFHPKDEHVSDPFVLYKDFGAYLLRSSTYDEPIAVPALRSTKFSHGIMRTWDDAHVVVKCLNRVC